MNNEPLNDKLPEGNGGNVSGYKELNLPENLIQGFSSCLLFKTNTSESWDSATGDSILSYKHPYIQLQYRDSFEVYGDGSLLFSGPAGAPYKEYSQSSFIGVDVLYSIKYYRPIYKGNVDFIQDGTEYRITGELTKFACRDNNEYYTTADDNTFHRVLDGSGGIDNSHECPLSVIKYYSDSSITVQASKYNRINDEEPWVYSTKDEYTFSFSNLDRYAFIFYGSLYEKSGSSYIYRGASQSVIVYDDEIIDIDFAVDDYFACWDEGLLWDLGFNNTGTFEGNYQRYEPVLPVYCGIDDWPEHPYSNINVKRNNPNPQSTEVKIQGSYDTNQHRVFVRTSDDNKPEEYTCWYSTENVYKLAPVVPSAVVEFPVYDDSYSIDTDSYSISSSSHTLSEVTEYSTEERGFQSQIMYKIINDKKMSNFRI